MVVEGVAGNHLYLARPRSRKIAGVGSDEYPNAMSLLHQPWVSLPRRCVRLRR